MKTKAGTEIIITDIKGKPYMQVAQRLVWFREEHPDWTIETSIIELSASHALFKCRILKGNEIIANAHKREDAKHFQDFIEKAETGSIGRALAMCGYGTQFATEIEEGERIVDAPIERKINYNELQSNKPINPDAKMTDKQWKLILVRADKIGMNETHALDFCLKTLNKKHKDDITMSDVNLILDAIKNKKYPDEDIPF